MDTPETKTTWTEESLTALPPLFSLSRSGHLTIVGVAIFLAIVTYLVTVQGAFQGLSASYREADVISTLFAEDPSISGTTLMAGPEEGGLSQQERVLFRVLQMLGAKTRQDDPLSLRDETDPYHMVYAALLLERGKDDELPNLAGDSRPVTPTIEVVTRLIHHLNYGGTGSSSPVELRNQVADLLAAVLAGQPGVQERYLELLDGGEDEAGFHALVDSSGEGFPITSSWAFASSPAPPDEAILQLLMDQFRIHEVEGGRFNGLVNLTEDEDWIQFQNLLSVATDLIGRLHAEKGVKMERAQIALWRGYEQFGLWFCLYWMIALLLARAGLRQAPENDVRVIADRLTDELVNAKMAGTKRARMAEEIGRSMHGSINPKTGLFRILGMLHLDGLAKVPVLGRVARPLLDLTEGRDVTDRLPRRLLRICVAELRRNPVHPSTEVLSGSCRAVRMRLHHSRWVLSWTAKAMPAIGFIGTVRGISSSLREADSIVRAESVASQAAAITAVAGTLGIAFMTTLIALLMGLATSLLNDRQSAREGALVEDLEQALMPLLEPALAEAEDLPAGGPGEPGRG